MELDLAISPCPNDTFIFHRFREPGFTDHKITLHLQDVEELNRRAMNGARHAISKLSYFAIAMLQDEYRLLSAGGALGRGCGPILITGNQTENPESSLLDRIRSQKVRILIPGEYTTANLLLHLYLKDSGADLNRIEFVPERYDRIMKRLSSGEDLFGVIIHEERFTYTKLGLHPVRDMGEWWENKTGLPIPLGGIAIRRDIPDEVANHIESKIKESILDARNDITGAWSFIKQNAQSMDDDVIRSHINLYVNDYSIDPGDEGRRAIETLFSMANFMVGS